MGRHNSSIGIVTSLRENVFRFRRGRRLSHFHVPCTQAVVAILLLVQGTGDRAARL